MFTRELEIGSLAKTIHIDQDIEGDTGVVVWDAAIVLAKYIGLCEINKKTVVELGSGTGVVGLSAAALGGRVLITDLEENLNLLKHNINKNKSDRMKIEASVLRWGDKDAIQEIIRRLSFDFVLVADCVYYAESLENLVDTLVDLSNPSSQVLVSYEDREFPDKIELQKRFLQLMQPHFSYFEVPLEDQDQEFRSPDIHILNFKLRTSDQLANLHSSHMS
jgi:predicted nicotinamide N-methyase